MSLTGTHEVFASIDEGALNAVLEAFFDARPRRRCYGSPIFVPTTTVDATEIPAIAFPGVPGGIGWRIGFTTPVVDLFEQTQPLPPGLSLEPGQFSLRTEVELCVNCVARKDVRGEAAVARSARASRPDHVVCAKIGVFGIGHLDVWNSPSGDGAVRLRVDRVELVDIRPDALETVLECVIKMILDGVLSTIELPLRALRAGAFELIVEEGPEIAHDCIQAFGNV
ncbi:MAG TPA: hypothetical protein VGC30_15870 [Dokdonella sp.]